MQMMRYGVWVLEQHLAECQRLQLHQHHRVVEVVRHIVFARRLWLERLRDGTITATPNEVLSVDQALQRCAFDTAAWVAWLDSAADDDLQGPVAYTALDGTTYTQSLADITMHVVNHTTHHAHELAMIVRAHGGTPPQTDYIVYTRQHR